MYVNRWSGRRATRHVEEDFKQCEERSQHHWSLGLGPLLNAGIQVREPPEHDDRDMIAFALQTSIEQSRDVWRPERARAVAVASYGAHPDRMPDNAFPNILSRHKAQGADELQPNNERSRVAGRRSSPAQNHPAVGTTNDSSHDTDSAGREALARIPPAPRASLGCYGLHGGFCGALRSAGGGGKFAPVPQPCA